jgi:hypothetical protein
MAGETGGAAGGFPTVPPALWPTCTGCARISKVLSRPRVIPVAPAAEPAFIRWDHWCVLGKRSSHVFPEGE